MTAPGQSSPENLCAHILAEARRAADAAMQTARADAAARLARAALAAEAVRRQHLDEARAEAARKKEALLATVSIESARLQEARLEATLQEWRADIGRSLAQRAGFDYRDAMAALAAGAIATMDGEEFTLELSGADVAALGPGWTDEVIRRLHGQSARLNLVTNPAIENGLIVKDAAGRQVYDNRLAARLDRLWPELRRQIAARLEAPTA